MDTLPPEICAKIVQYVGSAADLLSLCRVCKQLLRAAQPKLYESVVLRDPQTSFTACTTINANNGHLGAFVRRFWLFQDPRRTNARAPIPRYIWEEVRMALKNMVNLEQLHLQDPTMDNSWILAPAALKFQLLEANIGFLWDANVVAFLQTQNSLKFLHSLDSADDGPPCPVPPGTLPNLECYNGTILVVNELLASPLTHIQVSLDDESVPLTLNILSDLGSTNKSLRSLSILYMPEHMVLETLQLISTSAYAASLHYLGLIPLPIIDRHKIHAYLMRFSSLKMLHVDITNWDPLPPDVSQRMLATELRIFCPTLFSISFWIGQHHLHWCYRRDLDEWTSTHYSPRSPHNDTMWRGM